ncbi:MAG: hypothetical protein R3D98_09480 [Candidatus Krumholzibacteriia bacterium]
MRTTSRLSTLVLVTVLVPLAGGCLFGTRDPEPPQTAAIDYLPRSSPSNVWENCRLALTNKDSGGWDTAVSENFVYVPDGATETSFPGVAWASWDKPTEMTFIGNWFASGVTIQSDQAQWKDPASQNTNDGSGGFAQWDVIYFLSITDSFGSSTRYRGRAVVEFTLEGSYWYLSYWRDEQGEQDPENPTSTLATMGALRGTFGS